MKLDAFTGYGIEIEYAIVNRADLSIRPIADRLLHLETGSVASEVNRGMLGWSNEMALHLIELKNPRPTTQHHTNCGSCAICSTMSIKNRFAPSCLTLHHLCCHSRLEFIQVTPPNFTEWVNTTFKICAGIFSIRSRILLIVKYMENVAKSSSASIF